MTSLSERTVTGKRRASSPLESSKPKRHRNSETKSTLQPDSVDSYQVAIPNSALVVPSYRNVEINLESEWGTKYRINLPGAEVFYRPDLVESEIATRWYEELSNLDAWYRPTLSMYGKPYIQSRSIASYITSPNLSARYSGHSVQMNYPYPPILTEIQNVVSEALGIGFDHIMLNWYQDGTVHIGKHRDTKENQVIASLSLGAPRTFIMSPHISKGKPKVQADSRKWILENGSLVVMQGETQENWKHEIPKEPKVKTGRISLTFRQLVHDK